MNAFPCLLGINHIFALANAATAIQIYTLLFSYDETGSSVGVSLRNYLDTTKWQPQS